MLLELGSRGAGVRELQTRLNAARAGDETHRDLVVDGIFGRLTLAEVLAYQGAHNLEADGRVGDRTWEVLTSLALPTYSDTLREERAALEGMLVETPTGHREQVLRTAIGYLGTLEMPYGSNGGPVVDRWSTNYPSSGAPRVAWCALFVSGCLAEGVGAWRPGAEVRKFGHQAPATSDPLWQAIPFHRRLGGVLQIRDWAIRRGVWAGSGKAEQGDVFVMTYTGPDGVDTGHGHTGFVVDVLDGELVTIEGNTSNAVRSRRRSPTSVSGVVQWWR